MAALDTDFLTRIVNVHWTGGLAVEFTDRPDYLTLPRALSMNKATISFWFRVPTKSANAARARTPPNFGDYRVFYGIVPLITWGAQQTTPVTDIETYDTGAINESATPITLERISGTHTAPLQPSGIGVSVGSATLPQLQPSLDVHIQTNVHATGTGLKKIPTAFTGDFVGINVAPPFEGRPIYFNVEYTFTDVSETVTEEPQYLGNSDANTSFSGAGYPDVTLDKWHHLLISWDLLSHSNTGGASKMWCAIDDVNKDGNSDLPAMCNTSAGMGLNDHMCAVCFDYQGHPEASVRIDFGSNAIPSDPFRIPAPPSVKRSSDATGGTISFAPIETVELAELQIFSGVTLNTSSETNRRAFIDYERDEAGNPIRDEDGKRSLKPVNPKQAEELLGQKPDILLHGSTKWQNGQNTGSLGIDPDGEEIPSGQFQPTGEIKKYSPDPSIVEA
jgi:hypothetical protein